MLHMLIKYARVLICISAGEGSQHFSAFHFSIHESKEQNFTKWVWPTNGADETKTKICTEIDNSSICEILVI